MKSRVFWLTFLVTAVGLGLLMSGCRREESQRTRDGDSMDQQTPQYRTNGETTDPGTTGPQDRMGGTTDQGTTGEQDTTGGTPGDQGTPGGTTDGATGGGTTTQPSGQSGAGTGGTSGY